MDPREHPDNANLPVSNRPETILGVTITFLLVAAIAVCMRWIVRIKQRLWGWDDLFVFLAIVAVSVGSALVCLMPADGLGLHFWTLDPGVMTKYFKHVWASNVTYTMGTTFVKVAILIQYLRLFEQHHFPRKLTWGLLGITSLWGLAYICLALFSCAPIQKNWYWQMPGHCIGWGTKDPNRFFVSFLAHNITNLLLDVTVLCLPVPFFRQLRAAGKTRTGLISLFTMGAIACTLSLARIVALSYKRVGTTPVFDVTFYTPNVYIFSVLEIDVAILCASIPIFWPLVASLASNKILIVNEIEIRTERRSDAIHLTEHGQAGFGDMDFDGDAGRVSRMSVLAGKPDIEKVHRSASRLHRSLSRQHHRHKASSSSSSHHAGFSLGSRPSQDSHRDLHPIVSHKASQNSFSSRHGVGLAPSENSTHAQYADKYVQEWAVPDFDRGMEASREGRMRAPGFRTEVSRAEVLPFDCIGPREK